jgi:maleylacetoacetate isomerase
MSAAGPSTLRLYHFATSNSSWRVRWALALKGVECEYITVDLATGAQHGAEHLARNPLGLVPVLERVGEADPYLAETVAIIDWLERQYPSPRLLPADPRLRAKAHQLAQIINADTHPLQNRATGARHSDDPAERLSWNQYWIGKGLHVYETILAPLAGRFSLGDAISYPDLFLVPMCRNAINNQIALEQFPTIAGIYARARETEAAKASEPERYLSVDSV